MIKEQNFFIKKENEFKPLLMHNDRRAIDLAIQSIVDIEFVASDSDMIAAFKIDPEYAAKKLKESLESCNNDLVKDDILKIIDEFEYSLLLDELMLEAEAEYQEKEEQSDKRLNPIFLKDVLKINQRKIDIFELIKDLNISIKDFGEDLSEEDKSEIIQMAEINWRAQNPAMAEVVVSNLAEDLKNSSNQKSYILKFENNIIGFVRFVRQEDGDLEGASFNIENKLKSLGLGDAFLTKVIIKEAKENNINITVSPRLEVGTYYVEKVGFELNSYIPDYEQTGEPLFGALLEKENERMEKDKRVDDILMKQAIDGRSLSKVIGQEEIILYFDMKDDFTLFHETMKKLLPIQGAKTKDSKYKISRYFSDKDDEDKRYFVFNKVV